MMQGKYMQWIVFSDLDGTLLDYYSYSFAPAKEGLNLLKNRGIPLILCSSKTHKEIIRLQDALKLNEPFISENGSAVFCPRQYFKSLSQPFEIIDRYEVIVLGKPIEEIIPFLESVRNKFKLALRGFHEMEVKEIQEHTAMETTAAKLAKERFFSVPFILTDKVDDLTEVNDYVVSHGFRLLRGNRFYHLLGKSDKGQAVQTIMSLYAQHESGKRSLRSIGIGDSLNDLELLENVNVPVLVKKHDGTFESGISLQGLLCTEGIGPDGWNEAILKMIKR